MRCLFLFSGGLDSILGVKVLQKQNIQVEPITFVSYFFGSQQAKRAAQELKLKLRIIDFKDEHLAMVKNPHWGYGKNMNPCIDCHLLMLKKAREIMKKEKYSFVATGEVWGERPMSQNKSILDMLEKKSGLEGQLLRPLSALLLKPTKLEFCGRIKREKLLDINGRSRKRQFALAKEFKIKKYPTPAGGCLLTDQEFSKRLKELFKKSPTCSGEDVQLLKFGRHFWIDNIKIVVGRNNEENQAIEKLVQSKNYLLELKDFPGPLTLVQGKKIGPKILKRAGELTAWYSTKAREEKKVKIIVKTKNQKKNQEDIILVRPKR